MSWNLAKGTRFLSGISVKNLKSLYRKENDAKAKLRLLAAVHRKEGKSLDHIVEMLGVPHRTVLETSTKKTFKQVSENITCCPVSFTEYV